MAVIIDHFKNDRIYNNELTELVPCNKNTLVANNKLKKEVKKYDSLTFGKRKELADYAQNINCAEDYLVYSLFNDTLRVGYYYNIFREFVIETIIGKENTYDNEPFVIKHIFSRTANIIRIERGKRYDYIPVINMESMNEAYTEDMISRKELNYTITQLHNANDSLENIYRKTLIKK